MSEKIKQHVKFYGTSEKFLELANTIGQSVNVEMLGINRKALQENSPDFYAAPANDSSVLYTTVFEINGESDEKRLKELQQQMPDQKLIGVDIEQDRVIQRKFDKWHVSPVASLAYEVGSRTNTHKRLTECAFTILANDNRSGVLPNTRIPFWTSDLQDRIIDWSYEPDNRENGNLIEGFYAGHFYNPKTNSNYMGKGCPTAWTRAQEHYLEALDTYTTRSKLPISSNDLVWYEELGMALHYLQDATCPFHAANDPSFPVAPDLDHTLFEKKAEDNFSTWARGVSQVSRLKQINASYEQVDEQVAKNSRIDLTKLAATKALAIYDQEELSKNKTIWANNWERAARSALAWAQEFSAMYLYQFFAEVRAELDKPLMNLVKTMGATTLDGSRPYAFVEGVDGNLWVNYWKGDRFIWNNLGTPAGVSLVKSMGAITIDGGRFYVFVEGSDGNLWVQYWTGSACKWDNLGTPPGVRLGKSMGATTIDGCVPFVFVEGVDGNLWVNYPKGNLFIWFNLGAPAGVRLEKSMGAITIDGGRFYVFVEGSDGNLWVNYMKDSFWKWDNLGTPPGVSLLKSMGATTIDGGRFYVFVEGSDGNLWVQFWTGSACKWDNLGTPPGLSLGKSMGATTIDGGRFYVFVEGSDGNLWAQYWTGSTCKWESAGTPLGVSLEKAMGTITANNNAFVFVEGSDGNLWIWGWENLSKPGRKYL